MCAELLYQTMKNRFCFFSLIFVSYWAFAQNTKTQGIVEYQANYKLGLPTSTTAMLYFDYEKSVYFTGEPTKTGNLDSFSKLIDFSTNKISSKFYTYLRERKVHHHEYIEDEHFVIHEKLLNTKWHLSNEKKEILGYQCQKATGIFRGRQYTLWFSSEIPASFGPWKFNGLPGLILEVKENSGALEFLALKITLTNTTEIDKEIFEEDINLDNYITLKDYQNIRTKKEEEFMKKIIASMPKGTKATSFNMAGRDSQIELEFEWETKEK